MYGFAIRQFFGPHCLAGQIRPKLRLVPMPPEQIDKTAEFKRWLALFFIAKGRYKITDKGYQELAPQVVRQNLEFGESVSDRKREPRIEGTRPLMQKEIVEAVAIKVDELLREGKAEELYNRGLITRPAHFDWQDKQVRITVIKKLLEFLGASPERLDRLREELDELILKSAREEPIDTNRLQEILDEIRNNLERIREITGDVFSNTGLTGLLSGYYNNSLYLALVEAGYAYSIDELLEHARTEKFGNDMIYPWEMKKTPSMYDNIKIRIAATNWLVWKLKKEPKEITHNDFKNNGLGGLLGGRCNRSLYLVLLEAGYAYSEDDIKEQAKIGNFRTERIYPWQIDHARVYHEKDIRIAAVKWLIWRLERDAREITVAEFGNNGLSGLLVTHYDGSPYLALIEASYAYSIEETKRHAKLMQFGTERVYPWEMFRAPFIYEDTEDRIAAIRWLAWRLKKDYKDIGYRDFCNNGLNGVINKYYGNSPYLALLEADLVTPADEAYMRERGYLNLQKRHS